MKLKDKQPVGIIKCKEMWSRCTDCSTANDNNLSNILIEHKNDVWREIGYQYKPLRVRTIKNILKDEYVYQMIDYTIPLKSGPLTDLPFHTVPYHTQIAGITNTRTNFKEIAKIYRYLGSQVPGYLLTKINEIKSINPESAAPPGGVQNTSGA